MKTLTTDDGLTVSIPTSNSPSIPKPRGITIKSILVPLDFSSAGKRALAYASSMAAEFTSKITLLFVIDPVSTPEYAGVYPMSLQNDELVRSCKERLQKAVDEAKISPSLVEDMVVCEGPPYREIVEFARQKRMDLIIISTHGHTGISRLLLGSVAERVVRCAPCPVLIVRECEHEFLQPI